MGSSGSDVERTRSVVRTGDPSAARELVAGAYTTSGLQIAPRDTPFTFERTVTGTSLLSLESMRCSGSLRGEVDPGGTAVLAWLKSGRGSIDGDAMQIGRPKLFRARRQEFRWEGFHQDAMRIDQGVVERVAAERGGWTPGPLEFQPHHVPDGAPLAAWWSMVSAVAPQVLGQVGPVPLEREQDLARIAAAGLLTAIPHWPAGRRHDDRAHTRLAKAERFLAEHAAERVEVHDVATAADLSTRGLQSAFQRAHGMSPMSYLRGIRLGLARQQLESGEVESIASVARSVGMPHLSRFADAYRAEFGHLPSEALQAAQSEDD